MNSATTSHCTEWTAGKPYGAFLIKVQQTSPVGAEWTLHRRFSDFAWLKERFDEKKVKFPVGLPGKTLFKHRDPHFLESRRQVRTGVGLVGAVYSCLACAGVYLAALEAATLADRASVAAAAHCSSSSTRVRFGSISNPHRASLS